MNRDYQQLSWNDEVAADCRRLVRMALDEDLTGDATGCGDLTTAALVPDDRRGAADVVARESGVVAGMQAIQTAVEVTGFDLTVELHACDGDVVDPRTVVATLRGSVAAILMAERTILNLLGRMMGVATRTGLFVAEIAGTKARLYDTRKTTLGWRRLEKYAVRCGGGRNHRLGLYDAVLIKDNHLAQAAEASGGKFSPADAVRQARSYLAARGDAAARTAIVEIEVDSLAQLRDVLPAGPDLILVDNMSLEDLREAVRLRDASAPAVELEASGGVRLDTVREIACTGVDRISVGGLTHSAIALDVALDWHAGE